MRYMEWVLAGILLMAVALSLGGCFGNAEMVAAMAKNNATFCAKIVTPWGGATYLQSNPVFGTATCDGLSINYGNPNQTVSVPVTIRPDVSIGAPIITAPYPIITP